MNLTVIKGLTDGTVVRSFKHYDTPEAAEAAMYYEAWYAVSTDKTVIGIVCVTSDDAMHEDKRVEWSRNTGTT